MNKTLKKFINIFIIILSSVVILFLVLFLFGYVLSGDLQWKYTEWRDQKAIEKENKDFDKKLIELRKTKPAQYLKLMEKYKYFAGMNKDRKINLFYEVSVENNIPVLSRIDFYNGKKVIFFTRKLTEFSDEFDMTYSCIFKAEKYSINIVCGTNYENEDFILVRDGDIAYLCEEELDKTLASLSSRITKTQLQYTGIYDFERLETIKDYGNKEDYEEKLKDKTKTAKEISVICTGIGNFYAKLIYDTKEDNDDSELIYNMKDNDYNDDRGWTFFIDKNNADIFSSVADGHSGTFEVRCYFLDDYIIYHSYSDLGYFEGGNGYTLEYKVYFKKNDYF